MAFFRTQTSLPQISTRIWPLVYHLLIPVILLINIFHSSSPAMEAPLFLVLVLLAIFAALALYWLVVAVDALSKPYENPSLDCVLRREWNRSSYCAYYNGTVYYYAVIQH